MQGDACDIARLSVWQRDNNCIGGIGSEGRDVVLAKHSCDLSLRVLEQSRGGDTPR